MKKIFLFFFFYNFVYSQNCNQNDSIYWSKDLKLVWEDFKGSIPFGEKGNKKAVSSLNIVAKGVGFDDNNLPNFKIQAIFIKSESWVVLKNIEILKHEQGHFDLTEIYCRKLRKVYKIMNKNKITDLNKYYLAYDKIDKELEKVHNQYDKEVNFIPENRIIWYNKIEKELEELKEYQLLE